VFGRHFQSRTEFDSPLQSRTVFGRHFQSRTEFGSTINVSEKVASVNRHSHFPDRKCRLPSTDAIFLKPEIPENMFPGFSIGADFQ
jgi:hypothetical protein